MDKRSGFLDYFFKMKGKWRILLFVLIGVLLILVSSLGGSEKAEEKGCDIEELCSSVEGVGECRVMLTYADDGQTVVAVAVVCSGGDSVTVRHRLTELLSSLYGIGFHRISIEKMK